MEGEVVYTAKAGRYVIRSMDGSNMGSYYDLDQAIEDAEEKARIHGENYQVIDTGESK